MTVSLSLLAGSGWQFFDNSGDVLTEGLLYSYAAGTTTPATTYTSVTGLTANNNPIELDAAGRVPNQIWLTDGVGYKFRLEDENGVQIGSWDNITSQDTGSTSLSASAISYTAAGSVTVRTVQAKLQESVSVKDFGAVGDGTTNDAGAIQSALNSGAKAVHFPDGVYLVQSALTVPTNVQMYGDSKYTTQIKKGFSGDLIAFGEGAQMHRLYLEGQGATYTGRGIVISGANGRQVITECKIVDFAGFCIEFELTGSGSQSSFSDHCYRIYRYNGKSTDAGNYAVKVQDAAE
jgi:hypothetical protein